MPFGGVGLSGTWDTDSSAGLLVAVLRSTGAVPSSPQAPHQSGCHPLEHGVWTVDCSRRHSSAEQEEGAGRAAGIGQQSIHVHYLY